MAISNVYYTNTMNRYNNASSLISSFNSNSGLSATSSANSYSSLLSDYYGVNKATDVSESAKEYLTHLKSTSSELSSVMDDLRGLSNSAGQIGSSNSASVSVKSTAVTTKGFADTSIKVDQAASGQVNEGEALSAAKKFYSNQSFKIAIESEGKTHNISFSVKSGDSYEDLQKNMAAAINKADIGIKASVSSDTEKGTNTLTLSAKNTGDSDANRFTIKDVSGKAVSLTGAANVLTDAQDAIYSINGGEKITSSSNSVDLGNGVSATIKKASDTEVIIGAGKGSDDYKGKIESMVSKFNTLLGNSYDNRSDKGSSRLYNMLKGSSSAYSSSLERIGISVSSEGKLSIDEDKLDKAISDGSLKKFFTDSAGANYGFANRLSRIADDVGKNTASYISKSALGSSADSALSYYGGYKLSQLSAAGLMFDMYL